MEATSLKKRKDFALVYSRGRSCATESLVLVYLKRKYGGVKVGYSVSKKIGKSVVRNRARRRLKEAFKIAFPKDLCDSNLVFIARRPLTDAAFSDITRDMAWLLKKSGLSKKEDTKEL